MIKPQRNINMMAICQNIPGNDDTSQEALCHNSVANRLVLQESSSYRVMSSALLGH